MALEPSVAEQALLADNFSRRGSRLHVRERTVEAVFGASFLLAVSALSWIDPPQPFALAPALLCIVAPVPAQRVQFDTPFGFTSATQLAFVPLLFALPVALVPPAVVLSLVVARLPEVLAGEAPPSRLLLEPGNSWFAIGPAAVFALAGTPPAQAGATLLLALLANVRARAPPADRGAARAQQRLPRDSARARQPSSRPMTGTPASTARASCSSRSRSAST